MPHATCVQTKDFRPNVTLIAATDKARQGARGSISKLTQPKRTKTINYKHFTTNLVEKNVKIILRYLGHVYIYMYICTEGICYVDGARK